jgi:cytochrome c553
MKPRLIRAGCAAALLAVGFAGGAAAQESVYARNLASACFTCHGTDGRSVGGVPPALAGKSKAEMLDILKGFKSGTRPATLMHQQAKGYSDQQLEVIAGYFASAKPCPASAAPAARVNF